jgi:predicted enzyme related to lactoylglutathione lyase
MSCHLHALSFDADQPRRLARFWSGLLGWEITDDPYDGVVLPPADDTGFRLRFRPARGPKVGQNQAHFDLTSASPADQERTVARALELGARHIARRLDPGETTSGWVELADPDGNEFCVLASR